MVVFISTEDVIIKGDWVVMSIEHSKTDVILIGGGIMSATLGTLLKDLSPEKKLKFSKNWNNQVRRVLMYGIMLDRTFTLCELNYTKENKDGSIDVTKAIKINEQFQVSKQFWAYLVRTGQLEHPGNFIQSVPHMSFVKGILNVDF